MFYLQREHASGTGYEYATAEPTIADGDVSATWGTQPRAHPFTEADAVKWARLLGCGVTMFEAPAPEPAPVVDPVVARRQRVAEYLAEEQRKAEEAARTDAPAEEPARTR